MNTNTNEVPNLPKNGKEFLVFSQAEAEASTIREGFWSNVTGWGDFSTATRFSASDRDSLNLPVSARSDAQWVDADELHPFFQEQEQRAKLAGAIAFLADKTGIKDPIGAKLFFTELLDSVETLTGIVDQYGARTLADLMFLQNAIANGTYIDEYVKESSVTEVVKELPSAERWLKHVSVEDLDQNSEASSPRM